VLGLSLAGAILLWAAFPPLDLPWLAWIAPLPWLWLIRLPELPGRRPYLVIYVAGFVHWLAMMYGIRMAHPALNAGWIALAAYLAAYPLAFVGLTRVAVHQLRISLVIAAPVVWVGLELLRGHLISGFSMGLLAHTQAEIPVLIQISDLAGGYALSFVIMLVAASLARMIPCGAGVSPAWRYLSLWPLIPAAAALAATIAYGSWRLNQTPPAHDRPAVSIAMIQGSLDTKFLPPEKIPEQIATTFQQYGSLTSIATADKQNLDLVIWPESMFMIPERIIEEPLAELPQTGLSAAEMRERLIELQREFHAILASEAARANANTQPAHRGTLLLVGTNTAVYGPDGLDSYNTALLADREGKIVGRYHKTHAVMFGEYIPLGDWLPWIYKLTPLPGGMSIGDGPRAFDVAGVRMSPSICFESTVPHLIRGQVVELARRGQPVDVLVNVTNDGWFKGQSILDLHLRCGVFRAVENRRPLVVAANTGFSASIDASGVIRKRGPRRATHVLIDEVRPDGRASPYHWWGDLPANLCALACLGLVLVGWSGRKRTAAARAEQRSRLVQE
jgi:apolipoprotein N-acyltransferase